MDRFWLSIAAASAALAVAIVLTRPKRHLKSHAHEHNHTEPSHGHQHDANCGCCGAKHDHGHAEHSHAHEHAHEHAHQKKAAPDEDQMPARMKAALARKAAQANSSSTSKPPAAVASAPKETSDHSEPARKESRAAKAPSGPPPLGAILALQKETGKPRKECKAALVEFAHDFEQAKASLMPAPPEAEACCLPPTGAAVDGLFEPCAQFAGGRPGWIFKSGPCGVGYYRDAPMQVSARKDG